MRNATRWMGLAMAALAFLGATGVADDATIEGDLKKLQGTWVKDGGDGPESTWAIKGEELIATVDGNEYKCKIKLDEKAQPQPAMDIEIKEAPGDAAGMTSKAIYKFEGEKLLLCVGLPGRDDRPTEFRTTEDESYFFELKKEK